ncbi:MAG TPA: hypothetical protein VFY93_09755 [Planctomycetota bacterium]|nr:hypothetical protein [Planctomycetota bacterium]
MPAGFGRLILPLALLAGAAAAAPAPEVLREEAYNYRVVGELPRGWSRRTDALVFVYAIDEIPHAYVHLLRGRVDGAVDVEAQLRARAPHYRFPGAPADAEVARKGTWAGRDTALLEHEAEVNGVKCRRRVEAFVAGGIWFERIETIYGASTEEIEACRAGLDLFRKGFRLLSPPLTAEERTDAAERTIEDRELGFRVVKPAGFLRKEVDLVADPGLRVAFEKRLDDPRFGAVVRLFEYGVRDDIPAKAWMDIFYGGFQVHVTNPARAAAKAPEIPGAAETLAERFTGVRDGRPIEEVLVVVRAEGGRIFCLRTRTSGQAEAPPVGLQVNG